MLVRRRQSGGRTPRLHRRRGVAAGLGARGRAVDAREQEEEEL